MTGWTPAAGRRLAAQGILAINFHELRPENRDEAASRLQALSRRGPSWRPTDHPGDQDDRPGPRVFVGFYDGFRETALWGAEVCDRLGLVAHFLPIFEGTHPGQAGLNDAELAELAERHEIGFHTNSHRFVATIDESNLAAEVTGPVRRIEAATGRLPWLGAWCGGTRFEPETLGNQELRDLGVRYLISNWSIEAIGTT